MILIALGANLPTAKFGAPENGLRAVPDYLRALGIAVVKTSVIYHFPAWPDPTDPPFVNQVLAVATDLLPEDLLSILRTIEQNYGRAPISRRNAPRVLDLDLLAYDDKIITGAGLAIPHPRLAQREFVLRPLCDIAPNWRHPVTGHTALQLLAALPQGLDKSLPNQG